MIDAHNHLQDPRFGDDLPLVIGEMKQAGIRHAIVNGTSEADWEKVLALHHSDPAFLSPALGLHPWRVPSRSDHWLPRLRELLDSTPASSIGECGLDLWIQNADLAEQWSILQAHIDLSRELDKPLTLHCLKAWPQLLQALQHSPPLPPFLLHSFGGPSAVIPALVKLGAHFSLSGYFLHPRKRKALQAFATIPADRIHIETDAPDMAPPAELQGIYHRSNYHHPADLSACIDALAAVRNISPAECSLLCEQNSRRLFSLD
jgi:TatD DNase family protein